MHKTDIRRPRTASPQALAVRAVANGYNFPLRTATGKGYTAGLIELGGGFTKTGIGAFFTQSGLPTPSVVAVPVGSGVNKPDGPNGADGEVQSDIQVFGAVAPEASQRVYFADNTNAGFLAALERAVTECNGVTVSWGSSENNWDAATMNQFEAVIKAARANGVPVFVAAGDTGSQDSSGDGNQVDFPASSPSAIGCGGTRLTLTAAGTRAAETVWDDNDTQSATGGGVSKQFPGRDVPDIAGNADPDSGYEVLIDGEKVVIGGTSLVAPLMLGLHALLWESLGGKTFDFMNTITANPQVCFDVTSGDNGKYRAGTGRDETTGFGVPDGARMLAVLQGSTPAPPVTPPTDPTPPAAGDPLADFPTATVEAWLSSKHDYNHTESAAASAITAWAAGHGITLTASA